MRSMVGVRLASSGADAEVQMGIEDELGEFLQTAHEGREPAGERGETETRVESLFDELSLPWSAQGDLWHIDSDVGLVAAGLDEDKDVLTFIQMLGPWNGRRAKKMTDFMEALLKMNSQSSGACFAIFGDRDEGEEEQIGIVARIAAQSIDKEEIALALTSLFRMSKVFD